MIVCNSPKIVVRNGLKPIKQAKIEYLKRKPARERGLFSVENFGNAIWNKCAKKEIGVCYNSIYVYVRKPLTDGAIKYDCKITL